MARKYDFIVYAASGFTGKYVCVELHKVIESKGMKWAMAGRSKSKLEETRDWLVDSGKIPESQKEKIDIVVADANDAQSLFQICKLTRVMLDCAGPYRFLGEAVVEACIDAACDYVDISGEPEYLERIKLKYHEKAREREIYMVGSCGFDCIPSDLGVMYAKREFKGTLSAIECYFTQEFGAAGMKGNYGTYATLVHSMSSADSLREMRRSQGLKPLPICGPKLKFRGIHKNSRQNCYGLPFLGADIAVVKKSQRFFMENYNQVPVQYSMYFALGLGKLLAVCLFGLILKLLTKFSWGTRMMLRYPEFFTAGGFSRNGPTEEQMYSTRFNFMLYCKGYEEAIDLEEVKKSPYGKPPRKEMVVKVSGPEIGYVLTPIAMVQCALCMVFEREKLPFNGGVYTPGSAFSKTDIIENLGARDVKFEVLDSC